MLTYLSTWVVQDGEVPELHSGSILKDYGVRASGRTEPTAATDGVVQVEGPDPDGYGTITHRVTGTVTWSRPETWEWVIQAGEIEVLAHLSNLHPPARHNERITVLCGLSVIPEYEWLSFGLPNIRRDWLVESVAIQHRSMEWRDDAWYPTTVIGIEKLERMSRWTDEHPNLGSAYLLDLVPSLDSATSN